MNKQSNHTEIPHTMEEGVKIALRKSQQRIRNRFHKCEKQVRKSPTASLLGAVAVGYLLHRLPVRAILVTQVRVLSAMTPPALMLFGTAKFCEVLQWLDLAKRK